MSDFRPRESSPPAALVARSRDAVFGLVEKKVVDLPLEGNDLTLHGHTVRKRIDLYSELANNLAIDLDGTGENQFIILAARAYPSESEKSV